MKRYIKAAAEKNEALEEAIDDLEKLQRDGKGKEALTIALDMSTELKNITDRVVSSV